jgi:3-hydroxybutyryl-CoA dehydratase
MSKRSDPQANSPSDIAFDELSVEQIFEHHYVINEAVYESFLCAFGDVSPLHVDESFATGLGFSGRVMHGSILNGFVSHFVGMCLPGRRGMLQSVVMEYKAPCYLGDQIVIQAVILQKVESLRIILMQLTLQNLTQEKMAAKAKVQVGFLL